MLDQAVLDPDPVVENFHNGLAVFGAAAPQAAVEVPKKGAVVFVDDTFLSFLLTLPFGRMAETAKGLDNDVKHDLLQKKKPLSGLV